MRLTAFGFKSAAFYLAVALTFFAAPYSNLFFLLLAFLTLMGLTSVVWTLRNMSGVDAGVSELAPVVAGSSASCATRVRTTRRRVTFQIRVEILLENGASIVAKADCLEGESELALQVPELPRGLHQVRRATVSSTYPLGLFLVRRSIEAPSELVVYPRPTELVSARTGADAMDELMGEQLSGAGDLQPSGLRDHREGDELRSVHWRATARRGKPVVREWEGGGGQGLEVLIDRRCEPEQLEEALSFVSALVAVARSQKEVLAIHSQDLSATYGEGHQPWSEALRFLAAASVLPADGPQPPPVSPSIKRLPALASHAR